MKWLRSEEMEYMSLILNEDAAHDTIQKLGDLGVIEFTDVSGRVKLHDPPSPCLVFS